MWKERGPWEHTNYYSRLVSFTIGLSSVLLLALVNSCSARCKRTQGLSQLIRGIQQPRGGKRLTSQICLFCLTTSQNRRTFNTPSLWNKNGFLEVALLCLATFSHGTVLHRSLCFSILTPLSAPPSSSLPRHLWSFFRSQQKGSFSRSHTLTASHLPLTRLILPSYTFHGPLDFPL